MSARAADGSNRADAALQTPVLPRSGERIPALDGLRGRAILMVLVMHCSVIVPTPAGIAVHDALKRSCALFFTGVDLFFVLSGFLIGGILLDHQHTARLVPSFFVRRALRIFPLYGLLLLSFIVCRHLPALAALSGGDYFISPVPTWTYFTMVQNIAMSAAQQVGNYWLSPTWSLGIGEQFYLLMPFVVRRFGSRGLAYVAVWAVVICPALRIATLLASGNSVAATFLLPMRADALLAGVLCAVAVREETAVGFLRRHRTLLGGSLASLALFLVVLTTRGLSGGSPLMVTVGYPVAAAFFSGLLLWVLLFPSGMVAQIFRLRPLCAIGVVSYFIYLCHTPVFFVTHWLMRNLPPLHQDWTGGAITLLALGLTGALSIISYRWLEAPLLRLGRRYSYQ